MLSDFFKYIAAILLLALSVVTALLYRSKAKYEGAMRKGQEQVIKTERKARAAIDNGRKREKEARKNAKDSIANRTFFS